MSQRGMRQDFVILGTPRTGSNLLRTLLASHPQVVAYAELFVESHCWFEDPRAPQDSPELVAERDADPVAFVEKYVFREYPDEVRAVGFKLFYHQAPQQDFALWRWLDQRDGLRVIHLRRRNLFRQYVSHAVATSTGVWRSNLRAPKEMLPDDLRLTIDPVDCERMMGQADEHTARAAARLASRPVLELAYEDLAESQDAVMREVQQFLGLVPQTLTTPLLRQVTRPLRELIANYDELAARFASTRWASCFDE